MTQSGKNLAFLISKIERLDERQNITAKYAVGVKRQLDELTEKFNDLQQQFDQQVALSNHLNGSKPTNGLVSSEVTAVEPMTDTGESLMLNKSTGVMLVTPVEAQLNVDADSNQNNLAEVEVNAVVENELDEETTAAQQEEFSTIFSDEEFKIERAMWLLNRIYATEAESQDTPISKEELLQQYEQGKRKFRGVNLAGINLYNQSLAGIDLQGATLVSADLSYIDLTEARQISAALN